MDIDKWIETLRKGDCIEERELKLLCSYVKDLLIEEGNVQPVSSPVTVCGDIHGQFYDLLELFKTGGEAPETSYVFMGDYVDRGHNSVETFTLLMCLKARYPDRVTLLRGNHETRQITQVYGFYDECVRKYGNANPWRNCVDVFDHLSIAALIDGKVLCVHGGLSPEVRTLDQVATINRLQEVCIHNPLWKALEVPHEGAFCDMMWSDPEDINECWAISPRGAGYLFGDKVTDAFCHSNGLELICRAHQLVMEGWKYHFKKQNLVTVWSAPNYCYRCGNSASVLALGDHLEREHKLFQCVNEADFGVDKRSQPTHSCTLECYEEYH